MQQFPCSACGKLIAAQTAPGSRVQCPLCGEKILVPPGHGASPPPVATEAFPTAMTYGMPTGGPQSQGMAIASLVVGCCGLVGVLFCPALLLAIVGLVLGIVALTRANRDPQHYGGRGLAIAGISTSAAALVLGPIILVSIFLPSLSRARELSKRTVCAANMRRIGQAMYIYAQSEPDYAFPDDITRLVTNGLVTPTQFMCPSAPPGTQCYYYVPGSAANSAPGIVLMYENPSIHMGEGGNVLYQDGHVRFEKTPALQSIVNANKAKAQ